MIAAKMMDHRHVCTYFLGIDVVLLSIVNYFSVRLFVGSAWSFVFLSSPQRPMISDFEGFSIPDFIHYIYFPILMLEKKAVFSLLNVQC